jgi:hypothetical protein
MNSGGRSKVEDIRQDPKHLEYLARRHWCICLAVAAHAVMQTRDCYGVISAAVTTWEIGSGHNIVQSAGYPPLSALVAGNLVLLR